MASVRFADLQSRPVEFLDFTSLTLDEFQQLVPPFEAAFHAHMESAKFRGETLKWDALLGTLCACISPLNRPASINSVSSCVRSVL